MIRAVIFDYDWVLTRYYFRPQADVFNLAKDLRAKGIKTAMLSNRINPLTWLARRGDGLADFDPVVFSSDIGVSKPNAKAYQVVLDKLGLKPEECLFVDNRTGNLEAAEKLGINTLHAHNTKQIVVDIQKALGL
jgi:putative hydrolase of the HAD superfamily